MKRAQQTGPGWAVLLVLALCLAATEAQRSGDTQAPSQAAEHISSSEAPGLKPTCEDGAKCCLHNDSPADCASTASRNQGCRSDSSCVPAGDPCAAARNETGCVATGPFCKFDINTFTCKLDTAKHSCAALTTVAGCQAAPGCRVQHVCRDSCAACPSCLDAMRAFAKMPSVLSQLERNSAGAPGGFQATAFLTGYCHAAAAGILRASQDDLMAGCSRVAEDVARSPALLSRPAALCKRLGLCHSNCLVDGTTSTSIGSSPSPSPSSSGSSNSSTPGVAAPVLAPAKDGIDLCSPTGLVSGAVGERVIDRSKAKEGSVCLSSADCPSGMDCDTFSHSQCWAKCDKATGMDTCLSAGQCVDICQRPDIKAVVEDSRRRYQPCAASSNCSRGEECRVPDFACTMVQCNPHAISRGQETVEFVPCDKICLPETPRMVSAAFSDDGASIQVKLNQEAAPMNALCAFVFDEPTSALLGGASTCTTEGDRLTIWLAGDVRIRPNKQGLALGDINALFTSAFGMGSPSGAPMFSGSLPRVAPCRNCSASAIDVRLMGPTEIAMGCDNDASSAEAEVSKDFMLGAPFAPLGSAGFYYVALPPSSALWMIQDLRWSVDSPANVSVAALQKLVAELNNKTENWDRQMLTIPFSTLKAMPEGPVTLTVNMSNVFGVASSSSVTFKKKNATQAPLFQLDQAQLRFFPSQGFRVDSLPLPSACPNTKVSFKWSSSIPNVDLSDASSSSVVFTPTDLVGNVEVGKSYTVTLSAAYEGSSGTHSETVSLLAAGSPLSVNLTGPSGTVPLLKTEGGAQQQQQQQLVFSGQGSVDPDDPFNTGSQMSYLWSCVNTEDLTPCFGKQQDGKWVLDAAQLKEGVRYVVTLTIAKGDRSATESRSIIPGNPKSLSAEVRRSCGVDVATGTHLPCPSAHNPTDPLTLIAIPDAPFDLDDMLMSWWYDPIAVPHMQLDDNNTASGTGLPSLTVLPDALPNGGAITINLNFSLNPASPKLKEDGPMPQNFSGTSSLTVPLNGPPYCSSSTSECLTLDRSIATFPDARFRACAVAWADPESGPLTYEFGTLSALKEQQAAATNTGACHTFASLPVGPVTLYGCAVDALGARTCQEVDVAVLEPAKPVSPADIDQQLQKLNAELDSQANSSAAQPSTLVNKAMEVTSLLTTTTKQAVNSIADVVDTTVNGFKSVFDDLKKAFGGFTLSINAGTTNPEDGSTSAAPAVPERGASNMRRASPKLLVASNPQPQTPAAATAAEQTPKQEARKSSSSSDNDGLVLPKKTTAAAAQASTKLLVMMAEAGSERDADQTLSLLSAAEQLAQHAPMTPQGGVALLDLCKTAMVASSNANRPLSPQMSNTLANALTRGLDTATTPTHKEPAATTASIAASAQPQQKQQPQNPQQQQRRRLAQLLSGNSTRGNLVLLSPDQAFNIIRDGAYRLATAQKVTLGVVDPPVGNAGVCTGPALLSRKDVDSFTTQFDCQGIDSPAEVILPSNFSATCADSSDCMAVDDVLVMASYFSPGSRSVPIVLAVVTNSSHLLADDPALTTEVISGLVNITLGYSGPAGAFCAGETYADVLAQGAGCKAELELPLTRAFDAGKTAACVQLIPDPAAPGRLKPGAIEPVLSVRDVEVPVSSGGIGRRYAASAWAKKALASCRVTRQGLWLVAQFDPSEAQEESPMSTQLSAALGATLGSYELIPGEFSDEPTSLDRKAAVSFTYTFQLDGEAVSKSPVDSTRFKSELQRAVLAGTVEAWSEGPDMADGLGALRLAHVAVAEPLRVNSRGNLVADVTLLPPKGTSTEQLAQLSLLPPAELLLSSSSLRKDLITAERSPSQAVSARPPPKKLLGGDAIIGVVIGCVGVVAALLAAVVVVVRRRATVRARGSSSSDYSEDSEAQEARQALSTAGGAAGPSDGGTLQSVAVSDDGSAARLRDAAELAAAAASALRKCSDCNKDDADGSPVSCRDEAASLAAAAAAALGGGKDGKDSVRGGAAL